MTIERFTTAGGRQRLHFTLNNDQPDDRVRGAAEIYQRARAWGHLPPMMEFETFLAAMARGDDPFTTSNAQEAGGR